MGARITLGATLSVSLPARIARSRPGAPGGVSPPEVFPLQTHPGSHADLFDGYTLTGYDEMFAGPGQPRAHYAALHHRLGLMGAEELEHRHRAADLMMRHQGITFTVYGRNRGSSRSSPSTRSPGWSPPTSGRRSSAA